MKYYKLISSPTGTLKLVATDDALISAGWIRGDEPLYEILNNEHPILLETEKQLNQYFARERKAFSIPLDFEGSDFYKKVWNEMLKIPYGETRTYGDIAMAVGGMEVVRAVGGALNKNPIVIIGPCHRVIGSTGKLVGFGGGLKTKSFLLRLEDQFKNPVLFGDF